MDFNQHQLLTDVYLLIQRNKTKSLMLLTRLLIFFPFSKRLFYQKSNKNSPQKIGQNGQQQISKKNTPKFKDHPGQFIENFSVTRETSKRALFKSPLEKLTLNYNRKRIRSDSVENLNCENKIRRLNTPSLMQSDSNAKKNILSNRNDLHVKKRLFSGSHSDALPHSSSSTQNGFVMKQSMTSDIKRVIY